MNRPLIRDPQSVPVIGTDAHLPAVDRARLTPQALRALLHPLRMREPEIAGDGHLSDRTSAEASVLVALVQRRAGLQVLLTQRTAHLHDHAGQIAFPGGRAEPGDADAAATALREAQEEVGLEPAAVEVIGRLPVYTTVTAFHVTPIVGLVRDDHPPMKPDPFEVAEVFEVPLAFLMDPAHHRRHRFEFAGVSREFLSMPWTGPGADGAVRPWFIWGATAAMLRNLYRALVEGDPAPFDPSTEAG